MKNKKANVPKKGRKKGGNPSDGTSGKGVRGEILAGDGQTFTSLTALPRTKIPKLMEYRLAQSFSVDSGWFSTSTTVATFTYVNFSLSQSNQASALTDLFDQYMIDGAEVWILPRYSLASNSNNWGTLYSVIDVDDSNLLTSVAQANEYVSCVESEGTQGHYRHLVPHCALAAFSGAFTSYANVKHQWIDAASPNVQHYGIKVAASVTGIALVYDLRIRLSFRFRNVH